MILENYRKVTLYIIMSYHKAPILLTRFSVHVARLFKFLNKPTHLYTMT